MNTFLRDEAMRFLGSHKGREKAIPRKELEHHLRLYAPTLGERTVREIYAALPVCSSEDGLFVPPHEPRSRGIPRLHHEGPRSHHRGAATEHHFRVLPVASANRGGPGRAGLRG